jgi:hypothetical protein
MNSDLNLLDSLKGTSSRELPSLPRLDPSQIADVEEVMGRKERKSIDAG